MFDAKQAELEKQMQAVEARRQSAVCDAIDTRKRAIEFMRYWCKRLHEYMKDRNDLLKPMEVTNSEISPPYTCTHPVRVFRLRNGACLLYSKNGNWFRGSMNGDKAYIGAAAIEGDGRHHFDNDKAKWSDGLLITTVEDFAQSIRQFLDDEDVEISQLQDQTRRYNVAIDTAESLIANR